MEKRRRMGGRGEEVKGKEMGVGGEKGVEEKRREWHKCFSHTFPAQGHVFLYRNIKPVLLSVMDFKMLHPGCCDRFVYFNPHARCGVS